MAIEEAMLDHEAALGADLVARCRRLLQDRTEQLYVLTGEVARKLAAAKADQKR
jgi:hypothetical protein